MHGMTDCKNLHIFSAFKYFQVPAYSEITTSTVYVGHGGVIATVTS